MAIRRDDLRKTDFSDVSSGKRLAPVHPGDVLLKDFIEPLGISRYRVAKNINVPQRRIDLICRGEAACPPIWHCASGACSARRRNSGLICKRSTIWKWLSVQPERRSLRTYP
jgi:hypothetical protein